ncbi:hypothetical protein [Segniliparus rugosus]|uniref:Lipoprotein n=1 Tax=Segniliparus rugosus (strain ATCC BAA-974 / DSM 45345 / CCUG 50838 / CIP 108380 / JCM 13579 / CDC 945) TaxID=679197 RepID=E5XRG5_SEGRC|nr:hypothetical protein [Segniliparus rugosus]EFV13067.1 hypothetical protein HMPREF9336_02087 [Segniliparus rugosus ATCC BAA-974]
MPPVLRAERLVCFAAAVALLAGCAPHGGGEGPGVSGRHGASAESSASASPTTAAGTFKGVPAAAGDKEQLGDFCGWYTDELQQSMDAVSAFLGAFEVAGGDHDDPQIEGTAHEAEQAAGDAVNALNDFLSGFSDGLSEAARLAVLALRDAMAALASAIREQKGSEQINAEVALFNEAYKALRPACS